jgi:hypothetical protein
LYVFVLVFVSSSHSCYLGQFGKCLRGGHLNSPAVTWSLNPRLFLDLNIRYTIGFIKGRVIVCTGRSKRVQRKLSIVIEPQFHILGQYTSMKEIYTMAIVGKQTENTSSVILLAQVICSHGIIRSTFSSIHPYQTPSIHPILIKFCGLAAISSLIWIQKPLCTTARPSARIC